MDRFKRLRQDTMINLLLLTDEEFLKYKNIDYMSKLGFLLSLTYEQRKRAHNLFVKFIQLNYGINEEMITLWLAAEILRAESETFRCRFRQSMPDELKVKKIEYESITSISRRDCIKWKHQLDKIKTADVLSKVVEELSLVEKYDKWVKETMPIRKREHRVLEVNSFTKEDIESYETTNFVKTWIKYAESHKSDFMIRFFSYWVAFEFMVSKHAMETNLPTESMRSKIKDFCRCYKEYLCEYEYLDDTIVNIFKNQIVYNEKYGTDEAKKDMENLKAGNEFSLQSIFMCLYSVRCNLVHGEKCTNVERDVNLVKASSYVLEEFLLRLFERGLFEELGSVRSRKIQKNILGEAD